MSMLISESGHPLILLSLEFPLGNGRLQPVSVKGERERERRYGHLLISHSNHRHPLGHPMPRPLPGN